MDYSIYNDKTLVEMLSMAREAQDGCEVKKIYEEFNWRNCDE